jgi:hypothetical protein
VWTSQPGDPYLSITGHYIDAPADRPGDWKLVAEQLAFENIEGQHNGKNIALILTCMVNWYDLHGKVRLIYDVQSLGLTSHRLGGLPPMVQQ